MSSLPPHPKLLPNKNIFKFAKNGSSPLVLLVISVMGFYTGLSYFGKPYYYQWKMKSYEEDIFTMIGENPEKGIYQK